MANARLKVIFPDVKTTPDEQEVVEQPILKQEIGPTVLELCRVPFCVTLVLVLIIMWSGHHHIWRKLQEMNEYLHSNSPGALGLIVLGGIVTVACMALIGWTILVRRQARRQKEVAKGDRERLVVSLREICPVWIKKEGNLSPLDIKEENGKIQVSLDGMAHVWREPRDAGDEVNDEKLEPVKLRNERAAKFYQRFVSVDEGHRVAIGHLLMLLDQEGDCASVVSQQAAPGDVETSWDSNTYRKLGAVSLLDHTLNVAELVITECNREEAEHMINDAVIAALGHDIGKLPSKQPNVYSFGDHPLTSANIVKDIPVVSRLKHKDEILNAIKLHHKGDSNDLLTKILKDADMKARQAELELVGAQIRKKEAVENSQPVQSQDEAKEKTPEEKSDPQLIPAEVPSPNLPPIDSTAAWQTQHDIYGISGTDEKKSDSQQKTQIQEMDISRWFDADQCLSEIKRHINILDGNKFQAFSMPTGTVYVQTGLISNILMDQAQKAEVSEIALYSKGNRNAMQSVLLAAVNIFRRRNLIEASQVGDGFFGGHFAVRSRNGGRIKGFYAPFRVEAFLSSGESLGDLEQRKKGRLANFTSVDVWKE